MATSFLGLTVQEHEDYVKKATTEAPLEQELTFFSFFFSSSGGWVKIKLKLPHFHVSGKERTKFRRTAARTLRAWKALRDASFEAGNIDVQGSAPGQEKPRTHAYQTQGRLESMAALGNLAVWLHEPKLVKQTFWTSNCWMKSRWKHPGGSENFFWYGVF